MSSANFVRYATYATGSVPRSILVRPERSARLTWGRTCPRVLLLDERIRPDGSHARTWASCDGDRVQITDDDSGAGELPVLALDQIMRRYGRPLDPALALEGDSLGCGTHRLRRLRHHAVVDAEARDYLVWEPIGSETDEPLVCVAATVAAALRFLVVRRREQGIRNLR